MRKFKSGATRDNDEQKINYIGSFSPLVLRRFAQFMRDHNIKGGELKRNEANWKKGMPKQCYIESKMRHFVDFWITHEGYEDGNIEDQLCADIFNAQGYLHELLVKKLKKNVKSNICRKCYHFNKKSSKCLIYGKIEIENFENKCKRFTKKEVKS